MQTAPHETAMTEIALALAMGFFSLMVLTLISFGQPAVTMTAVTVADNAGAGESESRPDDLIVISHGDGYLGADMTPLTVEAINTHPGRVILAIDPATPLQAVVKRRRALTVPDLIVVELDAAWRESLAAAMAARK